MCFFKSTLTFKPVLSVPIRPTISRKRLFFGLMLAHGFLFRCQHAIHFTIHPNMRFRPSSTPSSAIAFLVRYQAFTFCKNRDIKAYIILVSQY